VRALGVAAIGLSAACTPGGDAGADGGVPSAGDATMDPDGFVELAPFVDANPDLCNALGFPCPDAMVACESGTTSISGVVRDPAGNLPLPNVTVTIPSGPIQALPQGAKACVPCNELVGADAAEQTTTDGNGAFTLAFVPSGTAMPVVIQTGKWRRQVFVDITACQDNPLPASLTRLPRNRAEGDMPQMAVVTGACDRLACVFARAGVDPSEFTGPSGGGRLHVYRGAGPGPDLEGGGAGPAGDCSGDAGACPLWSSLGALETYDLIALGCECGENNQTKPDMTPMHDWLNEGGQIIAIHDQETWLKNGPADFQSVATWIDDGGALPGPYFLDPMATPTLGPWLAQQGALTDAGGVALDPNDVVRSVASIDPTKADRWLFAGNPQEPSDAGPLETFVVPMPVGQKEGACGRAALADVHVGAHGATSTAGVPASCATGPLTPEEKALEYLLFDTSYCVPPRLVISPPAL
jgi:hypothetical protein